MRNSVAYFVQSCTFVATCNCINRGQLSTNFGYQKQQRISRLVPLGLRIPCWTSLFLFQTRKTSIDGKTQQIFDTKQSRNFHIMDGSNDLTHIFEFLCRLTHLRAAAIAADSQLRLNGRKDPICSLRASHPHQIFIPNKVAHFSRRGSPALHIFLRFFCNPNPHNCGQPTPCLDAKRSCDFLYFGPTTLY